MSAVLTLKDIDGHTVSFTKIAGFRFKKERYTPYSELDVTVTGAENVSGIVEVQFRIDGRLIHKGITDSLTVTKSCGKSFMRVTSRGFTSMLAQNELAPGLMTNLSLNSLMSEKMIVPNVTWQSSAQTVRYIYIKEHDSQWSAIVSLGLTLNGEYPYIGTLNEVRLSAGTVHTFVPAKIFEEGTAEDLSKMASHYHMKDAGGDYSYHYTDGFATGRGIVRHKYIPFDRQFIALDDLGLQYRLNYTERGCKSRFLTYSGYCGEELRDRVVFPDGSSAEISVIEVCGNAKKGIFTKDTCYFDRYCNT